MELTLPRMCAENASLLKEQRIRNEDFCLFADPWNVSYTSSKRSQTSKVDPKPFLLEKETVLSSTVGYDRKKAAALNVNRPSALSTPKIVQEFQPFRLRTSPL